MVIVVYGCMTIPSVVFGGKSRLVHWFGFFPRPGSVYTPETERERHGALNPTEGIPYQMWRCGRHKLVYVEDYVADN